MGSSDNCEVVNSLDRWSGTSSFDDAGMFFVQSPRIRTDRFTFYKLIAVQTDHCLTQLESVLISSILTVLTFVVPICTGVLLFFMSSSPYFFSCPMSQAALGRTSGIP